MSALHRILSRLFYLEKINGREMCPTYLYRWTLLKRWGRGIYLHKFVGDDWSLDLHDHPRRFISIGLYGSYREESRLELFEAGGITEETLGTRAFHAPWIRTFPATHVHRIFGPTPARPCWTLIVVLKTTREWGFWTAGRWVRWRDYIWSPTAEERKACS